MKKSGCKKPDFLCLDSIYKNLPRKLLGLTQALRKQSGSWLRSG
jgi:hypothetical protein